MRPIASIESYTHEMSKDLVSKIKILNVAINKTIEKIINFHDVVKEIIKILIVGGCRSGKTNSSFSFVSRQPDINKIYLYAKDLLEAKYQFLINKRENAGLKHFNDSKAFIEYSNDMDDIYKNIEEYNPNKKRKILTIFDDMITDSLSNKKLNPVVTELFIRGGELNIPLFFIMQCYFVVPKNIKLNSMHYFIIKFPAKQELAFNHSSDIHFQHFMNLYRNVLQYYILFYLLTLLLHQIIVYVSERIF